jgi:glycosyltransferase involved in cell wall biosynthesis
LSQFESILFWAYVVIGPLAFAFIGIMMFAGRKRMRRLYEWDAPASSAAPSVAVLIPAKDEGERVRVCLESVLAQDYPSLSVITMDDRSTDDTGRILDEIAAGSGGRVRSLHVPQGGLPSGWLGKCHALHAAVKHVNGGAQWLLFIDSDVKLKRPDAISKAVTLAEARNYDALSLMTAIECETFLERLVLPLTAGAWSVMNTISYTNNDSRTDQAYANGQFSRAAMNTCATRSPRTSNSRGA